VDAKDAVRKLEKIALDAGEILKEGFYKKKEVFHKGVVDLVTQYDRDVEQFIIKELERDFSDYLIVAEESKKSKSKSSRAIYIDPIDGTTNFVHKIPHFAVSIGLYEDDKALCGVVYNPILEEMFVAVIGEGAYKNGSKLSVSTQQNLQNSLIATGFPYSKVERGRDYEWVVEKFAKLLPNIQDFRRFGSAALDLCYLAEGRFEGFYEINLEPWDVSAGVLIVEEAGGEISNLVGESYQLGEYGIVATNGIIHSKLLEYIKN
jgi:myo-inositol-1(or 4)-monophosphatase